MASNRGDDSGAGGPGLAGAPEPFYTWGRVLFGWLGERGLAVLLILGATSLALRLVPRLLQRMPAGPGEFSREQVRLQTLKSVLESVLKVLIAGLGVLFALSNLGLNVTALLAGAGVVGLGISLAAQNLIRDVINGFFILLEDQYGVGDVITVGQLSGGGAFQPAHYGAARPGGPGALHPQLHHPAGYGDEPRLGPRGGGRLGGLRDAG